MVDRCRRGTSAASWGSSRRRSGEVAQHPQRTGQRRRRGGGRLRVARSRRASETTAAALVGPAQPVAGQQVAHGEGVDEAEADRGGDGTPGTATGTGTPRPEAGPRSWCPGRGVAGPRRAGNRGGHERPPWWMRRELSERPNSPTHQGTRCHEKGHRTPTTRLPLAWQRPEHAPRREPATPPGRTGRDRRGCDHRSPHGRGSSERDRAGRGDRPRPHGPKFWDRRRSRARSPG